MFRRAAERRLIAVWLLAASAALSGCGPKYTYPANKVPESVEKICKKEYKVDATSRLIGRTIGVVVYIDTIKDEKGGISKGVHELMGKVMQAVTRVGLSTDAEVEYCQVVIRDRQTHQELVITRSLDDTRRANADMIGIEESINRTLFGQSSYKAGPDGTGSFVLKEVKPENFLAEQIAQRIRFSYSKNPTEEAAESLVLVDGSFEHADGKRVFQFATIALKAEDARETMRNIFRIVNQVLEGYKFTGFDTVEIQDYMNRQKLILSRGTFELFRKKKITEDEILDRHLVQSQSIQDAFKLFGFNFPKEAGEAPDAAVAAAKATP